MQPTEKDLWTAADKLDALLGKHREFVGTGIDSDELNGAFRAVNIYVSKPGSELSGAFHSVVPSAVDVREGLRLPVKIVNIGNIEPQVN